MNIIIIIIIIALQNNKYNKYCKSCYVDWIKCLIYVLIIYK